MSIPAAYTNTQNYAAHGGASWVIGATGTLDIATGGKITNNGTQAAAIAPFTDSTGGTLTLGGTLTAFAVSGAGTVTAAQVAILNNSIAMLNGQIELVRVAIAGVGITA